MVIMTILTAMVIKTTVMNVLMETTVTGMMVIMVRAMDPGIGDELIR